VRSTDARLSDLLGHLLREKRRDEGSHEILFSADLGIERLVPGRATVTSLKRLFFGSTLLYRGRSMHELAARLISGFRDWTNHRSNEFFRLRAGSVAVDGGAVLLPSAPSTDLAALVALTVRGGGAGYLADEITNVDPVLSRAHGIGFPLLIDGVHLSRFPELEAEPSRPPRRRGQLLPIQARPRWPVRLDELGGVASSPTTIRWIVFPRFEKGAVTELQPIGKSEAMFRMSESALNLHIWAERSFPLMQRLLEDHPAVELRIGDLDEGAEWLRDLPRRLPEEEGR